MAGIVGVYECDLCEEEISGARYHCAECGDTDFCRTCQAEAKCGHTLVRIRVPVGGVRGASAIAAGVGAAMEKIDMPHRMAVAAAIVAVGAYFKGGIASPMLFAMAFSILSNTSAGLGMVMHDRSRIVEVLAMAMSMTAASMSVHAARATWEMHTPAIFPSIAVGMAGWSSAWAVINAIFSVALMVKAGKGGRKD